MWCLSVAHGVVTDFHSCFWYGSVPRVASSNSIRCSSKMGTLNREMIWMQR